MSLSFYRFCGKGLALLFLSAILVLGSAHAKSVPVEYVNELPGDVTQAITGMLPENVQAETPLHAGRQGRRARLIVQDTLNSFGYYNPNIEIIVEQSGDKPSAKLTVDPGPLFRIGTLVLEFSEPKPRAQDIEALKAKLPIASGEPAIPVNIIDAERVLGTALRQMGYAFSNVGERDVIGDKAAATISVRYNIASGARIIFGASVFPEGIKTKHTYLARLDPTQPGGLYDPAQLALYNSRLSETRLFSANTARLSSEPVRVSPGGDAVHDIIVEITERPRNTIALGGTYGTDEGFGVNAELTRRNITRRGDLLVADARIAQREKGLDLIWRRPNAIGYGKGLVLTSAIRDENTDAFDQQIFKLGAGYEVIENPKLNYSVGVRGQYIRLTENQAVQDFQTLSAYAGFNADHSDSLLDPRLGWRAEGRIVPTYAFGGSSNLPYVRAVSQGRVYYPLDAQARMVVAGRLRLGTLIGAQASDVPGSDRYYAGGGGSVRGYGYQAIGPVSTSDTPLGGRSLLDSSVEGRWRYNDRIGIAAFVDAGNVSDSLYPKFDNLRVGAGVGIRYMTPAGPLRVDVATPLNPSSTDESFQIYISIGQAF